MPGARGHSVRKKEGIEKRQEINLEGDENFYYLDFSEGFILVYILENNRLYANYISIKLFQKVKTKAEFKKTLDSLLVEQRTTIYFFVSL